MRLTAAAYQQSLNLSSQSCKLTKLVTLIQKLIKLNLQFWSPNLFNNKQGASFALKIGMQTRVRRSIACTRAATLSARTALRLIINTSTRTIAQFVNLQFIHSLSSAFQHPLKAQLLSLMSKSKWAFPKTTSQTLTASITNTSRPKSKTSSIYAKQ